jgi:hypothetical protein
LAYTRCRSGEYTYTCATPCGSWTIALPGTVMASIIAGEKTRVSLTIPARSSRSGFGTAILAL